MLSQFIFDDFHPVAKPIAAVARGLNYGPQEWKAHAYNGIGLGYSPEMFYDFLSAPFGRKITPLMEYFRLGTAKEEPTTYIHVDSGCGKYAAVWYLSDAPADTVAGTAFWRHKETGLYGLPDAERENAGFLEKLNADGADESKWTMAGLVGQKFNRCVVYPTSLFHSRYPKEAWGNDTTDGRIVFTCFFD